MSSNLHEKLLIQTIKDSIEYGEFKEKHTGFINYFINSLNISNNMISNAVTNVVSSLLDIKIDAPKASDNLKYFLSNINKNITINLNNIEYDDYEPNDIKEECFNITNNLDNINIIDIQ